MANSLQYKETSQQSRRTATCSRRDPPCELKSNIVSGSKSSGWSLPLKEQGKSPLSSHGFNDATLDVEQIKAWWTQWPNANIGILTGTRSGIIVLDFDAKHGGLETLRSLEGKFGEFPKTPVSLTGGGGQHQIFKHPGGFIKNRVGIRPGFDVRGDGGYFVAPPSSHISGKGYHWEVDCRINEVPIAEAPKWLMTLLMEDVSRSKKPDKYWVQLLEKGACDGKRNQSLASLIGHLLRRYVDSNVALEIVRIWNTQKNKPPLEDEEVLRTFKSISQTEAHRRADKERIDG